jgi:hypothetical protein
VVALKRGLKSQQNAFRKQSNDSFSALWAFLMGNSYENVHDTYNKRFFWKKKLFVILFVSCNNDVMS